MNNLIKCKVCGADIAKNSKNCPSCGAKNTKPFYKKWWVWTIAIIIILVMAAGTGDKDTDGSNQNSSDTASTDATVTEKPEYSIGDTITTDKFEITITNLQTRTSVGNSYLNSKPSEGGIYVCDDFEYKNITEKPISSISCPHLTLKDSKGISFNSDTEATAYYSTETSPDRKIVSALNPGITVTNSAVFEISADDYNAGGFSLVIKADKSFNVKI